MKHKVVILVTFVFIPHLEAMQDAESSKTASPTTQHRGRSTSVADPKLYYKGVLHRSLSARIVAETIDPKQVNSDEAKFNVLMKPLTEDEIRCAEQQSSSPVKLSPRQRPRRCSNSGQSMLNNVNSKSIN